MDAPGRQTDRRAPGARARWPGTGRMGFERSTLVGLTGETVANDEERERLYGPLLLFAEKSFRCGYAPRALCISEFHRNTAFVGCKDGSISVLHADRARGGTSGGSPALGDFEAGPPRGWAGAYAGVGAVRAFCEWDDSHLLVARRGGTLEILRWTGKVRSQSGPLKHQLPDPIRYLVRLVLPFEAGDAASAREISGAGGLGGHRPRPLPPVLHPRGSGSAAGAEISPVGPLRSHRNADGPRLHLLPLAGRYLPGVPLGHRPAGRQPSFLGRCEQGQRRSQLLGQRTGRGRTAPGGPDSVPARAPAGGAS